MKYANKIIGSRPINGEAYLIWAKENNGTVYYTDGNKLKAIINGKDVGEIDIEDINISKSNH